MTHSLSVLGATLMSVVSCASIALAQPACVTQNMAVPPGANTADKAAPFFIDTTGLDFKTAPPTRDPSNPNYPRATELPDGALPPPGAEGNFIIGPTHNPAPETIAKEGVPRGTTKSFTLWSKDSTIYNPGLIRDDVAGCTNSSIMTTVTAPDDKSNMIVTTSAIPASGRAPSTSTCRRNMCAAARRHSSWSATAVRPPTRISLPRSTI